MNKRGNSPTKPCQGRASGIGNGFLFSFDARLGQFFASTDDTLYFFDLNPKGKPLLNEG